jgi:hypothetical protein
VTLDEFKQMLIAHRLAVQRHESDGASPKPMHETEAKLIRAVESLIWHYETVKEERDDAIARLVAIRREHGPGRPAGERDYNVVG